MLSAGAFQSEAAGDRTDRLHATQQPDLAGTAMQALRHEQDERYNEDVPDHLAGERDEQAAADGPVPKRQNAGSSAASATITA